MQNKFLPPVFWTRIPWRLKQITYLLCYDSPQLYYIWSDWKYQWKSFLTKITLLRSVNSNQNIFEKKILFNGNMKLDFNIQEFLLLKLSHIFVLNRSDRSVYTIYTTSFYRRRRRWISDNKWPFVVYFDQQTGAWYTICWLKSNFQGFNIFFCHKRGKMHRNGGKNTQKGGESANIYKITNNSLIKLFVFFKLSSERLLLIIWKHYLIAFSRLVSTFIHVTEFTLWKYRSKNISIQCFKPLYTDTQTDLYIEYCANYKDQWGPGYLMLHITLYYI